MPHFTLQIGPGGPLLTAFVGVSHPRAAALQAANQPIPQPVQISALVDTGASCTCIDPSVLQQLKLTPTGSVSINTPTTGNTPHATQAYDVALIIPAPKGTPLVLKAIQVVECDLDAQGFQALIGRDILSECVLAYNGDMGFFTVAF